VARILDDSGEPRAPLDRRLLALAFGATFLSRSVVGAVVESLRAELLLTDQALGTLVSAFAAGYAVALPAGALFTLRHRRARLLAVGLTLCGAATAASAAAVGFWTLVLTRTAAGAGAGLLTGLAVVLLLDVDRPPGRAPRGLMLPAAAGLALGYLLGGLCGRWPGWRGAFVLAGVVLLALVVPCLRAGDPLRRAADPWSSLRAEGILGPMRRLAAARSRLLPVAAAVTGASAASALAFWLPAFLERIRSVPRLVAGAELGAAVLASGFAGAALGRYAVQRLAVPSAALWTAAAGTGAAALATAAALSSTWPLVVLPGLMVALLGVFTAARAAVEAHAGEGQPDPALTAMVLLLVHGAGELTGAFGIGAAADRASFGVALFLLPGALLASATLWAGAAWSHRRRQPGQVPPRASS
jgi:predicted MFS family arabinose efflux permease